MPPSFATIMPRRPGCRAKVAACVALIALADFLLFETGPGWVTGLFWLVCAGTVAWAQPVVIRHGPARLALAAAVLLALVQIERPGGLALILGWAALSMAVLLPRLGRFDDAGRWLVRLLLHPLSSLMRLGRDGAVAARIIRRRHWNPFRGGHVLILPVIGSALFLALFAAGNPVIRAAIASLAPGDPLPGLTPARLTAWGLIAIPLWGLLRPAPPVRMGRACAATPGPVAMPGVTIPSVTLSLLAFNGLFALQNGLDVAFMWSGAPLPDDLTLADYVHRGAYPLIATALLAGLFVLLFLRPGTPLAADRRIRRLVGLWIGQNIVLVFFCIERTLDYVAAFSLTLTRAAGLIWMGLVAVGLVLICWRLLRGRCARWLINANALVLALVLAACTVIDLAQVVARHNAAHNRELTGQGAALDLCYMRALGGAALVPLAALEGRDLSPQTRRLVREARLLIMRDLEWQQADWRRWSLRDARRLAAARALIPDGPAATPLPHSSDELGGLCAWSPFL